MNGSTIDNSGWSVEKTAQARASRTKSLCRKKFRCGKTICGARLSISLDTFGKENTVSAVLHMDETTPHIHATIVPIVMGERRKAKQKKQTEGKRTYRKKTDAARLCADDVLNRDRLVAYHDDYAKVMERYGLQRGVRGSEARHTTTAQYTAI